MNEAERRLTVLETVGTILWFAMDAYWMLSFDVAAAVFAVPVVLLALVCVPLTEGKARRAINAAIASWAAMNAAWMLDDLYQLPGANHVARAGLVVGLLALATAAILDREMVLRFMRRSRV